MDNTYIDTLYMDLDTNSEGVWVLLQPKIAEDWKFH